MIINSILVFVILLTVGGVVFYLYQRTSGRSGLPRYVERPLFDKGDAILFGRLSRALSNCYIFPHLSLAAILEPAEGNRKRHPERYNLLANLTVDFAVFNEDLGLVCVVCMEHSALVEGNPDPLIARFLKDADITAVRFGSTSKPSVEQITRIIGPLLAEAAKHRLETATTISQNTAQRIYADDPVPSRGAVGVMKGLTQEQLDQLTPNKVLAQIYPHIWQRVCLFAPEPQHLQKYLVSLSIQDRGEKRAGFPIEALKEIADIQAENDRFLVQPVTGWQPAIINR